MESEDIKTSLCQIVRVCIRAQRWLSTSRRREIWAAKLLRSPCWRRESTQRTVRPKSSGVCWEERLSTEVQALAKTLIPPDPGP